jgi:uncharacterized repeat protein (TIGR04052 family)
MKRAVAVTAAIAAIAVLGAAASGDRHAAYHIRFSAVVGNERFVCERSYHGVGTTHATITPEFLRLYIFGITLIDAAGKSVPLQLTQDGIWQQHDVALLSFEGSNEACASGSPQEHEIVNGTAPAARYVAIRFVVGVPQSLDHADATIASSPLNLSDMFWSWQDGYKFFRFDARVRGKDGRLSAFVFHLGSTGCRRNGDTTRCERANEATVRLQGFDSERTIVLDVAKLLERTDLEATNGCMMGAGEVCAPELRSLGVAGPEQTVFSVK